MSWMKKHATNLLSTMPIDNIGSALQNHGKPHADGTYGSMSEAKNKRNNINISDPAEVAKFKDYKKSGGTQTHTVAATFEYRTPQQSQAFMAEKRSNEAAKSKATRNTAEKNGLGTEFFASGKKDIYKKQ